MATYRSEEITLKGSADKVFARLSNLEGLKELLTRVPEDQIPEDKRQMFDNIEITADSITIPGGPTGPIKLKKAREVEPTLIRLEGEGTPVPVSLQIDITPVDDSQSLGVIEFELGIPAMLKPMVNGPLNKMTAETAKMLSMLNF